MSSDPRKPERSLTEAAAERAQERSGEASPWTTALRELASVDQAAYEAVAWTPTPSLDEPIRRLSNAANYSRLWLGIAAVIALLGGERGRKAALEGVVAIGVTSASVNLLAKSIAARPRPDREELERFATRDVGMPSSSSFPSGHAASAFAFSYAVGRHLPELAVPIRLLAGAVAYSRVHIGVHYPGDVAVGSMIGSGIAAMVASVGDRVAGRRRRAEAPSRGHPRRSSPSANSAAWARYSTKLTLVTSGPLKLVPWIVTEVPTGPPAGENELIVGAAAKAASAPGRATRIPISKNVADISPARLRTVLIMTNSPHHQKEPNHLNFQSYAPSHRGN